jgi:hypothetical protein
MHLANRIGVVVGLAAIARFLWITVLWTSPLTDNFKLS